MDNIIQTAHELQGLADDILTGTYTEAQLVLLAKLLKAHARVLIEEADKITAKLFRAASL